MPISHSNPLREASDEASSFSVADEMACFEAIVFGAHGMIARPDRS